MAISAKFEADFSQFTAAVKGAEGSLKSLETGAKTLGPAILASLASTEVRRFATDVKNVAAEFIGAFAEEEAAVSRLTTALKAQGAFTPELAKQYADLGAAFQQTTRFSDDAIYSTQALLVQVGGVMPGQMKDALTAITNLAAGLGPQVGGLEGAALLVAKAFSSDGEALGRLKVILGDAIPKGAGMAEVLGAINSKFGGQAQADLETASGSWAQLNNIMGDFKEKVGGLLLEALTPLMRAFQAMPDGMQTVVVGLIALGTALAPLAISAAALTAVLTPLAAALGITMVGSLAALGALLVPAGIVIGGIVAVYLAFKNWDKITAIAQSVYNGVKTWLVDKFDAIVAGIRAKIEAVVSTFRGLYEQVVGHSIIPDLMTGIGKEMGRLDSVMVRPIQVATGAAIESLSGLTGFLTESERAYQQAGGFINFAGSAQNMLDRQTGSGMWAGAAGGGGSFGGGGGVSVTNVFNVVDTEANIVRRVSDAITQSLKQSLPLRSA